MSATAVIWTTGWEPRRLEGVDPRRPSASRRPVRPAARPSVSQAAPQTSVRLTRRGRVVVSLAAGALAVAAVLSTQTAAADAPADALPVTTHTVAAGETLWQIAGAVAAPGQDRRDVVDRLVELNGLPNAALQAGQQIIIPAP